MGMCHLSWAADRSRPFLESGKCRQAQCSRQKEENSEYSPLSSPHGWCSLSCTSTQGKSLLSRLPSPFYFFCRYPFSVRHKLLLFLFKALFGLSWPCVHQWNSTIPPVNKDGAFFSDLLQWSRGFLVCWLNSVIMYKPPFLPPSPSLASMLEKIVMAGIKGYPPISNQG